MSGGIDLAGTLRRLAPGPAAPALEARSLRRVLIIKTSSIGDVVHALPVAAALKDGIPGVRLGWVVDERHADLVRGHAAIDRVVLWPRMDASRLRRPLRHAAALRGAIAALRAESYDVALDLQGLARTAWIALLSRAPVRLGLERLREGAHLVAYEIPARAAGRHAVDENLAAARFLGAPDRPVRFGLEPDAAASARIAARLEKAGIAGEALLVLTPSASAAWKSPGEAWWRAVARELAELGTVLLLGHEGQRSRHRRVAAGLPVVDWTGTTTLAEAVALLARADLHVGPDSGLLHVSAALARPTIGLYGPTSLARLGPWQQAEAAMAGVGSCGMLCSLACRSAARCLERIAPGEVRRGAERRLSRSTARAR